MFSNWRHSLSEIFAKQGVVNIIIILSYLVHIIFLCENLKNR